MATIEEIIKSATLREETATICVAGDLNARHEELAKQLRQLDEQDWAPSSLAGMGEDPRRETAREIAQVETDMAEHQHTFRFRGMPWRSFQALRRKHTSDVGVFDVEKFPPALVAACCVEPVFTGVEQVEELFDVLTSGQVDRLFGAAWQANTGSADIPKSVRASELTASSEPR